VYAILLAIPILGEQRELHWQFYAGVTAVMVIVLIHPFLTQEKTRDSTTPTGKA
jgi:hypothetical protein